MIGLSATTKTQELYSAEVELRNDIVDLLSTRRQYRRSRRSRLRYRKARWNNRVKSKKKGWLAPSVENKINTHIKIIADLYKILPITNIIVETASFDIQKINNPDIKGKEYQEGNQLGFWNVREYVLFRDGHKCCVKGCKEKVLNVHHIESRKTGGNAPNNLITICEKHHKQYHQGEIKLNLKRGKSFRDAAFMGIMRWAFYNKLKDVILVPVVIMDGCIEVYGYFMSDKKVYEYLFDYEIKNLYTDNNKIIYRAIRSNKYIIIYFPLNRKYPITNS